MLAQPVERWPYLMDVRTASAYLSLSPQTLRRATASGQLPVQRTGSGRKRSVRYRRPDLEAFAAQDRELPERPDLLGRALKRRRA